LRQHTVSFGRKIDGDYSEKDKLKLIAHFCHTRNFSVARPFSSFLRKLSLAGMTVNVDFADKCVRFSEYGGFLVWIPAYAGMTARGGFVALKTGLEMV
jgi:hypothetical protein